MWCTQLRLPVLLLACLGLTACVTNPPDQPRTVVVHPVVVTPFTSSSSIVYVPARDLSNCGIVPGRWDYSVWIPAHRDCLYTYTPGEMRWYRGCYYGGIYTGCGYGCCMHGCRTVCHHHRSMSH